MEKEMCFSAQYCCIDADIAEIVHRDCKQWLAVQELAEDCFTKE